MEFCPKCGSILRPKKMKNGVIRLVCPKCGYKKSLKKSSRAARLVFEQTDRRSKEIVVSEETRPEAEEDKKLLMEDLYREMLEYFEEG